MNRVIKYGVVSLLLILLQTSVVNFIAILHVAPDLLVVWIVYLAIRRGQLAATLAGFAIGLVIDIVSGDNGMLGLAALSKTVCGFVAGYFYNENKTIQTLTTYRFAVAVLTASFVHHTLYFVIFLQGSTLSWLHVFAFYGVPATVYTAVFSLLPMLMFARRFRR